MHKTILSTAAALVMSTSVAFSAGGPTEPLLDVDFSFSGIFGRYDQAQLQRGFQVYREVCSTCHGLNRVAYRNLLDIGLEEDFIKEWMEEKTIRLPYNDQGELLDEGGEFFTRAPIMADKIVPPYDNTPQAIALYGAYPTDLSLITKARPNGPAYVYSLLNGYPEELPEKYADDPLYSDTDKNFNLYFPGHLISMAQPLWDESVEFEDGSPNDQSALAQDVVAFLNWAAEPELDQRKSLGLKVIIFLIVLTAMLYALKRRIWADVKKKA